MRKVCKKLIIIFLIIMIMNNILGIVNISLAEDAASMDIEKIINRLTNIYGGVASIGTWMIRFPLMLAVYILNVLLMFAAQAEGVIDGKIGSTWFITPFDIFFNKFELLNINFFDIKATSSEFLVFKLRSAIAKWYYIVRLIASSILLLVLIYVGIRMAVSTLAEEKAKYKKMLVDWISSICLIFVLHYLIIFVVYTNNAVVKALASIFDADKANDIEAAFSSILLTGLFGIGIKSISATLVFLLVSGQTIGFFLSYVTRMIKIGFLIIISPLISVTYSIDKMGDGKAQALGNWLKEFIYTILIQPFHCIMYVAFVKTAFDLVIEPSFSDLFTESVFSNEYNGIALGLMACLCLWFVGEGEKAIRQIFGFADDNDTSFVAGLAVGIAALNKSKQIGSKISAGHAKARGFADKHGAAFKNGLNQSEYGQKILNFSSNTSAKMHNVMKPVSNLSKKGNEFLNKHKNFKSYATKSLNAAASIGAASLLLSAGKSPGLALKTGQAVSDNLASSLESRALENGLNLSEVKDVEESGKEYQDALEQEQDYSVALNTKNETETVNLVEQYIERDEKLEKLKSEVEELESRETPTEDGRESNELTAKRQELEQAQEEFSTPIDSDKNGAVQKLYLAGELTKTTPAGKKVALKGKELNPVRLNHANNVRNLRDNIKVVSGKPARQEVVRQKYERGKDKKNLKKAQEKVEAALKEAIVRNKYATSEHREGYERPEKMEELSEADLDRLENITNYVINQVASNPMNSGNNEKDIENYVSNAQGYLNASGESAEQIRQAIIELAKAQDDKNFADSVDASRKKR